MEYLYAPFQDWFVLSCRFLENLIEHYFEFIFIVRASGWKWFQNAPSYILYMCIYPKQDYLLLSSIFESELSEQNTKKSNFKHILNNWPAHYTFSPANDLTPPFHTVSNFLVLWYIFASREEPFWRMGLLYNVLEKL
jgi:hypothetical protein